MKHALLAIGMVLLGGCAHGPTPSLNCPPMPEIGDQETIRHYTAKVVILYDECSSSAQRAIDQLTHRRSEDPK